MINENAENAEPASHSRTSSFIHGKVHCCLREKVRFPNFFPIRVIYDLFLLTKVKTGIIIAAEKNKPTERWIIYGLFTHKFLKLCFLSFCHLFCKLAKERYQTPEDRLT